MSTTLTRSGTGPPCRPSVVTLYTGAVSAYDGACQDQETPLMRAVQYRHTEVVRVLLDHNANPNIVSKVSRRLYPS